MKKIALLSLLIITTIVSAKCEIRGVWIPDPGHTKMLHTYANIKNEVKLFEELGINTIYLCAYAKTDVAHRSDVYTRYSTFDSPEQSYMFAPYMSGYNTPVKSPTNDPVKDLITEAHKRGMKVLFWFEYGFMGTHGVTPSDHPLLSKNPSWQSAGNDGTQANYNGSDYYLNAYHPTMQEFLIELIVESVRQYPEIDGVQCDDRAPAMPRNSGYDAYTVARYQSEHQGALPPFDYKNEAWTRWRLDILNTFGRNLYGRVKAENPRYLVCFAPNPYPWCMDNLMQDSQTWLKDGIVDLLSVQCYRFNEEAYLSTVSETKSYITSVTDKPVFNPGIILRLGDKYIESEQLEKQIRINREIGTNGEAYFYNEGFANPSIRETLKRMYQSQKKKKR